MRPVSTNVSNPVEHCKLSGRKRTTRFTTFVTAMMDHHGHAVDCSFTAVS